MQKSNRLFRRANILRAQAMLDTFYTPAEFAAGIGLPTSVIYKKLLPAGLPAQQAAHGRYWIPGAQAAAWCQQQYWQQRHHPLVKLKPGEAYCLACQCSVIPVETRKVVKAKGATQMHGRCPQCERKASLIVRGK